jgi:hypothetical protein
MAGPDTMDRRAAPVPTRSGEVARPRSRGRLKTLWKSIRAPLARSRIVKNMIASLIAWFVRFVNRTNPRVAGSDELAPAIAAYNPAICVFWHGQHLLAPAIRPKSFPMTALFSRSADAELNALVAEKLGFGAALMPRLRKAAGSTGGRTGFGGALKLHELRDLAALTALFETGSGSVRTLGAVR